MRILVLADIHANWPALEAVETRFDVCLCLGDLVDYGVEPGACIAWSRRYARHGVRGNHDHGVAQRVVASGGAGYRYLTAATRPLMWELLSRKDLAYLARLPLRRDLTLGTTRFHLVHATPRDPLDEYLGPDLNAWRKRLARIEADFVCVGHTHAPFVLEVDGKTVLNPGSVGQPRDGDPRCSYAVIDDGRVEIVRREYDVARAVAAVQSARLPDAAKQLTAEVLRTGGAALGTPW